MKPIGDELAIEDRRAPQDRQQVGQAAQPVLERVAAQTVASLTVPIAELERAVVKDEQTAHAIDRRRSRRARRGCRHSRDELGQGQLSVVCENYPSGLAEGRVALANVVMEEPAYALTPMYTVVAVEGSGNHGMATFRTRYPDGSRWWSVNLYEADGERISRSQVFFAPEFEAPDWRAPSREAQPP
jgi:hypothetical protein